VSRPSILYTHLPVGETLCFNATDMRMEEEEDQEGFVVSADSSWGSQRARHT
jgi:hypothetical protein